MQVAVHYRLQRETIYSTQILLDSFLCLTRTPIPRTKFQLIGLACLLISAKLEEVRPPNLTDLSVICDEIFSEAEIAEMELEICSTLRWHLTPINTLTWLRFYMNRYEDDQKQSRECKLDFLIHSSRILDFPPSKVAAALMTETVDDPEALEKCTGYIITDLAEELQWIRKWNLSCHGDCVVSYVDPKVLKTYTEHQFDNMINKHRKSLNFIIKHLKLE